MIVGRTQDGWSHAATAQLTKVWGLQELLIKHVTKRSILDELKNSTYWGGPLGVCMSTFVCLIKSSKHHLKQL